MASPHTAINAIRALPLPQRQEALQADAPLTPLAPIKANTDAVRSQANQLVSSSKVGTNTINVYFQVPPANNFSLPANAEKFPLVRPSRLSNEIVSSLLSERAASTDSNQQSTPPALRQYSKIAALAERQDSLFNFGV